MKLYYHILDTILGTGDAVMGTHIWSIYSLMGVSLITRWGWRKYLVPLTGFRTKDTYSGETQALASR